MDELDRLAHDNKTYTLLNKAPSAAAPGSTFKLVTASAGLEEGNVTATNHPLHPEDPRVQGRER